MKHTTIILLLVCLLPAAYSYDVKCYTFYTDAQIKRNLELNKHEVCWMLKLENSNFFISNDFDPNSNVFGIISFGSVKRIDDVLYCYDRELNRTYRFRETDLYTLEALNHTALFVQGTKLYLHMYFRTGNDLPEQSYAAYYHTDDLIYSDYWKTSVKNGIYEYHNFDNKNGIYYYRNNIPLDSVPLDRGVGLNRDSASLVKEIYFAERYSNANNVFNYYLNDMELRVTEHIYLLTKGENIISVGITWHEYYKYPLVEKYSFKCIDTTSKKYELTLSHHVKDSILMVKCFKSPFPDEEPFLNEGDTLQLRR